MPGNHNKKDKLKKRIASIDGDITSNHKKKSKDKNKLIHDAKGVATNYNNPTKVKNRKLKGKVSKLKTRLAGLAYSDKKKNKFPVPKDKAGKPLWNEDDDGNPITKEDRMKRHKHVGTVHYDAAGERVTKKEYESGAPKITDKDVATQLKRTAQEHEHSIHFKGYKGEYYKRASLVSAEGRYAKYWLLNAKQTNGNGWGVSQQSIAKNIHKFVGKPLVVTAKSWVPDSVYGDAYEHPYLPTNDINKVLDHQEKYRVGSIVDIIEKDGDYFANIEINQKFAHMILPPFCSPAIFQNNPTEPEGQISDWEALHLAALHEDPAYGSRIALLRGTCVGTQDQCTVQFKSAKQEAKIVCTKDLKGRLATLKKNNNLKQRIAAEGFDLEPRIVSSVEMNQKDGETIANAYDKMLHDPNNPGVKESYSAFIKETEDQFNELKKNGLRIDPIKPGTNPYQTADDLHNDLKKNNHIYYYPSEEGFGSTDNKFGDHPLLKESNVTYKGKKLLNNDVFRIVHDINGHNLANSDFSPEGEHNAFLSHRKMYSPLAGKALFTETAAQANWGSYNKKSGASNRKLMDQGRVNELVFADQKAGLLPDDIINTEWHTGTSRTGKLTKKWRKNLRKEELTTRPSAIKDLPNSIESNSPLQKKTRERVPYEATSVSDEVRIKSQYLNPDTAYHMSKLKQRLGVIGMPEPFEDRYETVKNTKSNLSSFKIEDPEMDYILGKTDKIRPKKQGLDRLVKNRWAKQKTASSYSMPGWYTYGPDMDAIKAFQKKQEYQSGKGVVNRKTGLKRSDWKFRTDGKSLFLHDHEIAKHVKGGIQVSNAGYDTPLTYATLNALGINAKGTKYDPEGGLAELGSKKIDHRSKEWVFVPQDEIQSGPIVYSDRRGKGKQTGRTNEEQSIFRKKAVNKELNEQGRRGLPLSKTNIQPEDQKVIDKATGIKSKKPYETLATEAHHVLSYKDNPGLRSNEGNSIMLPADYHKFISNYEKSSPTKNLNRLKQMHSKLDRLIKGKQRKAGMSKKVAQIINSFKQSGFDPTGTSGIWDAQNSKNLNAYEKPDLERIWELYGRRGMGFNSITNTIEGPNNDIGLIAKQLTEIEEEGGIPALGFDNGSLEAVNVTYGTKDEVLDKLLPHQNSTGYIDEDGKLNIPDNPRYKDYLKEIERR